MPKDESTSAFKYDNYIPYRVSLLHNLLNRQATVLLGRLADITLTQWRMIALLKIEGLDTLTDMADASGIDKALLSRNLVRLIDDGYIRLEKDPVDRRVNRLRLTELGLEMHEQTEPLMFWRKERLLRDLSEAEQEIVVSALKKMEQAAQDMSFDPEVDLRS